MADISKITLPSNTTYNIKDATARSGLSGKQDTITAEGILQGDGTGVITGIESVSAGSVSIDSTPTEDSNNLVTSGGVYAALQNAGTGSVSSVAVSNATNGGLTVSGSPITSSGTITVGHTNVLTSAQTTQAVYPIKIDKNGHISDYGSAVTIPSAADATPLMDGSAAVGTSTDYAREDHVHPTDTSRAASSHSHGNITSGGDITATAPTIASGDQIIINDHSASKITNGPTFDGSTTTTYLSQKGTWESIPDISGKIDTAGTGLSKSGTTLNHSNAVTAQTTQALYPIKIDAQGHISAYGSAVSVPTATSTSPKMDGTATVGSETTWAKGDHIHPTDTSRQAKITASGILKGDGNGGVTAAVAGTDYSTTDDKVSQSGSTTANWRKLLLHYKDDTTSTTAVTSSTNVVYAAVDISAQPSTGTVRANVYNVNDKVKLQYNSTTQALDFIFI